jgi:hypothetical protein
MTLRGVYDNGTITLLDKNLPKIKTEVEVILHQDAAMTEAFGIWRDREDMSDSAKHVSEIRKKSSRRFDHESR